MYLLDLLWKLRGRRTCVQRQALLAAASIALGAVSCVRDAAPGAFIAKASIALGAVSYAKRIAPGAGPKNNDRAHIRARYALIHVFLRRTDDRREDNFAGDKPKDNNHRRRHRSILAMCSGRCVCQAMRARRLA